MVRYLVWMSANNTAARRRHLLPGAFGDDLELEKGLVLVTWNAD
jgi:hypothetical protein